jgi:hypothetical protein
MFTIRPQTLEIARHLCLFIDQWLGWPQSVKWIALYGISWFLSEAFLIGWNCSPVPREQFQPIKSFQSKQCISLQPIEIETCLHVLNILDSAFAFCQFGQESQRQKNVYMKLKSWFKSSQDISLLAFEYVVSKMNFYIFLTTFIGIIVSSKAK